MLKSSYTAVIAAVVLLVAACGDGDQSAVVDVVPAEGGGATAAAPAAQGAPVALSCAAGSGADFATSQQFEPSYDGESLACSSFRDADLFSPSFRDGDLSGADFTNANLTDPRFDGANLRGSNFTATNMTDPVFVDADLTGADLNTALMTNAVFGNTICPNGANSDTLGGTCLGGLDPAPLVAGGNGQGAVVVNSGGVASCAGRYTGHFTGDESGVVAVALGANGQIISSAYPGLEVSYSDDGFISIEGEAGSVSIGPGGVSVDGEGLIVIGPDGISVGGDGGVIVGSDGGVNVGGDDGVTVDSDGGVTIGGDDGVTIDPDGGISIPGNVTIPGSGGGLTIEPEGPPAPRQGVEVGPGGVRIGGGGGVVVTTGSSEVGDDGLVTIVTDDGRVLTGTFDWTTCTGGGTWTVSGRNGSWQVAQDTTQVYVPDSACSRGVYVGSGGDVLVGPGGVAVGSGGVSVGGGAVEVTPGGVSIGGGDVALDALCVSNAVSDGTEVRFDEVDDGVVVQQGDGFTSYGLDGDLLFAFNSAEVDSAALSTIDSIIGSAAQRYPGAGIQILGHTDSVGGESYNIGLSEQRAQAVAVIVAGDPRMAGIQLETFGLGETSPVAANANPDGTDNPNGRARNRRVEIVVLDG